MPICNPLAGRAEPDDNPILTWSVHLAREHPAKLVCSLLVAAGAAMAGYWVIGPLGSVAVASAMLGSLAEFVFPVVYRITPEGASARTLIKVSEIRWENVRRCYVDAGGVKLSPLDRATRLEAFRGVYLRFGNNDDSVIKAVRSMRAKQC